MNSGQRYEPEHHPEDAHAVHCLDCGAALREDDDACPACGSRTRRGDVAITGTSSVKNSIHLKTKEGGHGKPVYEVRAGDSFFRKTERWNRIDRIIDRKNDWYYERIEDESGNVIRLCEEPLSEHRGHGSAKS